MQIQKFLTVTIDANEPLEALMRFHRIDAEVINNRILDKPLFVTQHPTKLYARKNCPLGTHCTYASFSLSTKAAVSLGQQ